MSKYLKLRQLAERLTTKAGEAILSMQDNAITVVQKDRQDISTSADLASEKIIIDGIKAVYPDHQIQSEEAGSLGENSEYVWIIDPLDGTKEYVRNIPQYNVSIAIEHNGVLVAAAIYRPTDKYLYSASVNDGAFLNGRSIHISSVNSLADSFIYCYLPSFTRDSKRFMGTWDKLGKVNTKIYRLRSYADENTALCWLAQGGHEGYLNLGNNPKWHDIAPGILIAQEAGAFIPKDLVSMLKSGTECSIIITNTVTIWQEINNILNSK